MQLVEKALPGVLPYCAVVQNAIEMRKLFRAVGQVLAGNELGRVCALTGLCERGRLPRKPLSLLCVPINKRIKKEGMLWVSSKNGIP